MRHRALLGLLLAALALRLALIPYFASKPLFSDFQVYASDAERIAHGGALLDDPEIANRGPAYPLLLAAVFAVFGRSLAAAYALQALLWCATGLLTYHLARRPLGERAALVASAAALFHPDGIILSGLTGVECLAAFLLTAFLIRMACMVSAPLRARALVLDGLLAGVLMLTVSTLGLVVLLALIAVAALRARSGLETVPLLLLPAGIALALAPWTIRNAVVVGGFVPLTTISGTALVGGNNLEANGEWNQEYVTRLRAGTPWHSEAEWNRIAYHHAADFVVKHPARWALLELQKLLKFFSPKPGSYYRGRFFHPYFELAAAPLAWSVLFLFLPAGLARARRREPEVVLAAVAVAALLVSTLVFFALVRYRVPYIPAFCVLGAAGGAEMLGRWRRADSRWRLLLFLAVWIAFLLSTWTWILLNSWNKILDWLG